MPGKATHKQVRLLAGITKMPQKQLEDLPKGIASYLIDSVAFHDGDDISDYADAGPYGLYRKDQLPA